MAIRPPTGPASSRSGYDRPPHFLLVDDDELIGRSVARVLRVARPLWVLVSLASATEAARALAAEPFDVLIADLQLPGLPGTALLEVARLRYPCLTRVVFSALADAAREHPEVLVAA